MKADILTERETGRQTDRQRNRQTDRQRKREIDRQKERKREREREFTNERITAPEPRQSDIVFVDRNKEKIALFLQTIIMISK